MLYFSFPNSCLGTLSCETPFRSLALSATETEFREEGVPKQEFGNERKMGKRRYLAALQISPLPCAAARCRKPPPACGPSSPGRCPPRRCATPPSPTRCSRLAVPPGRVEA